MILLSVAPCSFTISLQRAEQDGSDAALWFSPQFSACGGVVVFASVKDGQSQREEKIRQFPFQKGQDFEIVFIVTLKGYQVRKAGIVRACVCVCASTRMHTFFIYYIFYINGLCACFYLHLCVLCTYL